MAEVRVSLKTNPKQLLSLQEEPMDLGTRSSRRSLLPTHWSLEFRKTTGIGDKIIRAVGLVFEDNLDEVMEAGGPKPQNRQVAPCVPPEPPAVLTKAM